MFSRAVPIGPNVADPGRFFGNITNPPDWADLPRCPAQPGAGVDLRAIAVQGWEQIDLPKPKPFIAPGWGLTGKLAYLETRGQLSHAVSKDTPVGPLAIDSTGSYLVDWGDGEKSGPYSSESQPWPDGQITHMYQNVGVYQVVVSEKWRATWRIGSASGVLTGQQTSGRIDGFRVEQIQAVVSAG